LWSPAFLEWFLPLILERHEKEASMLKQLFSKTAAMLCCLFVLTLYIPAPAAAQVIQSPSVNPGTLPSAPQGVQGENSARGKSGSQNQNRGTANQGQNSSSSGTQQTPSLNTGRRPYGNNGVSTGGNTGAGTNTSQGTRSGTVAGPGSKASAGSAPGRVGH
jgi:hypothetical protein